MTCIHYLERHQKETITTWIIFMVFCAVCCQWVVQVECCSRPGPSAVPKTVGQLYTSPVGQWDALIRIPTKILRQPSTHTSKYTNGQSSLHTFNDWCVCVCVSVRERDRKYSKALCMKEERVGAPLAVAPTHTRSSLSASELPIFPPRSAEVKHSRLLED